MLFPAPWRVNSKCPCIVSVR